MYKIQKKFIWQGRERKIKHSTPCNGHEKGGLKNVALTIKITSIQCPWVKKNDFKMIFMMRKKTPIFLIGKHLGKNFTFHNNIDINNDIP